MALLIFKNKQNISCVFQLVSIIIFCATIFHELPGSYCSAAEKCFANSSARHNAFGDRVAFPEVRLAKIIPLAIARNILENEKPPDEASLVKWSDENNGTLIIPSTLDTLRFKCSAKYRVQWGFESYPWITWDTWTGLERPTDKNDSNTFTAIVEFHRVQETSLQTRIPICYSVKDPCIQTALEPRSGVGSTVELKVANGSSYAIQSKSEKEQFGINKNCTLKFGYDPNSQKFYCQETDSVTNSTNSGKIFLRPCPDPVTCESLVAPSNCSSEPEDIVPVSECTIQNRCRMETAFAGKFPGVAVCHSGNGAEHSAAIPYFFSLIKNSETNKTKRYLNWNNVHPDEMIELRSFDKQIYTKEKINIACNASYFYLGSGMYFTLTKEDTPSRSSNDLDGNSDYENDNNSQSLNETGQSKVVYDEDQPKFEKSELEGAKESVIYDEANIGGIGSKLPLVRVLEVQNFQFHAPGKYEIDCYAPVWNTSELAKASRTVNVKESVVPVFDGGNMPVKQYYTPNKKLECVAYGVPKPTLNWTRDGEPVPEDIILTTGEQNQTLVWAVLTLPNVEYGVHGNFSCGASNIAGSVRKSFIIIPADKNSSTVLWVLVGLVVGIALLIPCVLFLIWKVRKQKQRIDDLTQEELDEFINGKPDYIPFQCDMSTYAYYLPYDKSYEIPRESLEIDLKRILGSGEYGLVVYALYKNANPPGGGPPLVKPVAVKTTKPLTRGKEFFKALLSELKIMTYIGNHDNIVNLIGACTQDIKKRELYIATEYCEHGSLLAYLRMNKHVYENPCSYSELIHPRSLSSLSQETSFINFSPVIDENGKNSDIQYVKVEDLGNLVINQNYENIRNIKLQDLVQWAYDIACGMEFLASKKVIHGDLAARNVLLTRDLTAKICDFGLSRQLYHYNYYTKTAVTPLPLKWLAIECLQSFKFSIFSDVWAYGVTLFEIFSIGEIPYSSVQMNGEEFLRALTHGMRLGKPTYAPNDVFDLMMKCWKNDRKQRPTFAEIVKFFQPTVTRHPRTYVMRESRGVIRRTGHFSRLPIVPLQV